MRTPAQTVAGKPDNDKSTHEIALGSIVPPAGGAPAAGFPEVVCRDPLLQPHLDKPWLKAWIGRELGLTLARKQRASRVAAVTHTDLARHTLIVGTSGSGKSRQANLIAGQILESGQSYFALEPKMETIVQIAAKAQAAGLSPEQVTVLSPRARGGTPGWNPFLVPLPAAENAEDFIAVIAGNATSWGPRLADILSNTAHVVAAHRLSVFELMRCLRDPDYLQALLEQSPPGRSTAAYLEAADALAREFLAGSKSARAESAGAVTNKIRKTLRSDFLKALLSARTNTLDVSRLWKQQGVVLVHLDRATLGEEGAGFLAGMVASNLFRTSLRTTGPVPVTLALDEIATAEHFVGDALSDIATFSRSANLRLLAAAQNLSQMGGTLREALLSANVQISFRLSPADARLVAASLSAGTESSIARVRAEAEPPGRRGSQPPRSTCLHTLRDASGRPLRLDPASWERLRAEDMFRLPRLRGASASEHPLAAILRLAAKQSLGRLFVRAADTGEPVEASRYVAGLDPASYWVDGPQPLSLAVSFPTPRLIRAERRGEADAARAWTRVLQSLPQQHAVLRVGGGEPVIMRVADVPDALGEQVGPYLSAALRANGQTAEEIEACARERREAVLRLTEQAVPGGHGHREMPGQAPAQVFETRSSRNGRKGTGTDGPSMKGSDDGSPGDAGVAAGGADAENLDAERAGGDRFSSPFASGGFADDGSLA